MHFPSSYNQKKDNNKFKNKNNQNCQKIELSGNLTTKELKKKHSSRLVGGAEMGNEHEEELRQGGRWQTRWARLMLQQLMAHTVPHLPVEKPGGTTGEQDRSRKPGFQCGKIKLQNL